MFHLWLARLSRRLELVAVATGCIVYSATGVVASPLLQQPTITAQLPTLKMSEKELLERAEKLMNTYEGDTRKLYEAKNYIDQALLVNPRSTKAYVDLASLALSFGYISGTKYDPEALKVAHAAIDKAFKLNPRHYNAHMIAGYLAWIEDDFATAKKMAAMAEKIRPGAPAVDIRYATIANSEYKPDKAITFLNKALAKPLSLGSKENAYKEFVIAYKIKKDFKQVERYYRAILAINPGPWEKINYADFLNTCSSDGCNLGLLDYDRAISYGESALKDGNYPIAHRILAELYFSRGNEHYTQRDLDGATSDFRRSAQHYRDIEDEENYQIVQTLMQALNLGGL
jgi:tetratricopeptide (TPR) repeat protein